MNERRRWKREEIESRRVEEERMERERGNQSDYESRNLDSRIKFYDGNYLAKRSSFDLSG